MNSRWKDYPKRGLVIGIALLASVALCGPALAQGGGGGGNGGGGGGETTTGNNLSYPVLLVGGATLTLRVPPAGTTYSLAGEYWYGWIDTSSGTAVQMACDPELEGCPPAGVVDYERIYLQKDPLSVWQAYNAPGGIATTTYLDWSDNLESTVWSGSSVIRVETVPFAELPAALGFQMWWASGKGTDEVWGARAPDADPPVPTGYPFYPGYATIYAANAYLTLQKLEVDGGSQSSPPITSGYTWDATAHKWNGVGATTTRIEPYTAEINVGGKAIYGFNWNLKRQVMEGGELKNGWWRLTFSTDGNYLQIPDTTDLTPPLTAPVADQTFFPQTNSGDNITYIDIFLKAAKGGRK